MINPSRHACIDLNMPKLRYAALLLLPLIVPCAFAAGSLPLAGVIVSGRASSDGTRVVLQLQQSAQMPALLQVIDASLPDAPKQVGTLTLQQNANMELSVDGRFALLDAETEPTQFNRATGHEITGIDLSDPSRPSVLWTERISARRVSLSPGASAFAFSRRSTDDPDRWEIAVMRASARGAVVSIADRSYGGRMALSENGKFLVQDSFGDLQVWNLEQTPPAVYSQSSSAQASYDSDCILAALNSGHVVIGDGRMARLGIYSAEPGIPRVATLPIDMRHFCRALNPNARDGLLDVSSDKGAVQQLDLGNPQAPHVGRSWHSPQAGLSVVASAPALIFAVAANPARLVILRRDGTEPLTVDWRRLDATYTLAQASYQLGLKAGKALPAWDAVEQLDKAGVLQALDSPVQQISVRRAAEIFNSYGFLVSKTPAPSGLVEAFYRRSIALDPHRAVAHLNLADHLRAGLAEYVATGGNADARIHEIIEHYRSYVQAGGLATARIKAFMEGDWASDRGVECNAIASAANTGVLGDWISPVGTNVLWGDKLVDIVFTTEGTAHVPTYYVFDARTDKPLESIGLPGSDEDFEHLWGGDFLGLLLLKGRHYILHYRDPHHPVVAVPMDGGNRCEFSVSTKELASPRAEEPQLCEALHHGRKQANLTFNGVPKMDAEELRKTWGESAIDGTRLLDFANDGTSSVVAQMSMSSGAGAGCDETFYDLLSKDGRRIEIGPKRDLLMQLQGADSGNRYPILPCGNHARFLAYKNQVFFETRPEQWPPIDDWNQYHRVTTVRNGQVREVCSYRFESRVLVRP
ncbi:hypothetical protein CJO82_08345 [Ralstonia solanacearum]|nr:hypothetical protein CJO82_08345 [Ralstonia solanacearum]AXW23606.1 hypothetical protein CJO86_08350 [Ralstonia solanacearum]AXW80538.1 hypothetical protein CJO98_08580 [Ralstonia solanacearum]